MSLASAAGKINRNLDAGVNTGYVVGRREGGRKPWSGMADGRKLLRDCKVVGVPIYII